MKNILLVTDSYPPEVRSASHLMEELAQGLKNEGYGVTVLTTMPRYNLAESVKCKKFEIEDGVHVIRAKSLALHKVNFVMRGISQLLLPLILYLNLKKHAPYPFDIVVVYSPPLPLGLLGLWLKRYHKAKFIINLQDIFPQNAIDLGIMRNPMIISFFEWLEKKLYEGADVITVHSEGNKVFLLKKKKLKEAKVCVIHNWIDIKPFERTGTKNLSLNSEFGPDLKFTLLFAGVLGPSQGLDIVIDAAELLRESKKIVFLMLGDGTEKSRLVGMVKGRGLTNVYFKPFITKNEYVELLKDVDVGLVCLNGQNKTPVVPGKLLGYMAAGIPIVAALNRESDGHEIIKEARCGFSVVAGDTRLFTESILKLEQNAELRREMGRQGFSYVTKNFTKEISISNFKRIFEQTNKPTTKVLMGKEITNG